MRFKKLVLDFDHTLFDDGSFMESISSVFHKFGISRGDFEVSYEKTKLLHGSWNPFSQARLIFGDTPASFIKDMDSTFRRAHRHVFPDAKEFLSQSLTQNTILSFGDEEAQMLKIKNSKIDRYFESIIITSDSLKTDFFAKQKIETLTTVFVDDRVKTVDAVKSAFPSVFCVLMKRPGSKFFEEPSVETLADDTVTDFYELQKIYEDY
ncbi:MAG: hypothetical protein WD898_04010 [Candidatus Paceibacterota bacterium]